MIKVFRVLAIAGLILSFALQPLPALANPSPAPAPAANPLDWSQYGHDAQRTNSTAMQVNPPYCFAWKWYEAPLATRAQPVVSGGRLFIGSMNGYLYARDASTGAPLWTVDAGSPIRHSAAVYNNAVVIFTSHLGFTFGLNAADGALIWQVNTGPSSTAPLVDEGSGRVVVSSSNGSLTMLNANSGAVIWVSDLGAPILISPALSADGGTIFSGTERVEAVAVAAGNGGVLWRTPLQGQSLADRAPVVVGNLVFYRTQPLHFFQNLLIEGDSVMDRAGGWSTAWDANVWNADWGGVRPQILAHLNANPSQQTFFALSTTNGALHPSSPAPVLYTYGNNDTPSQPVVAPDGIYLPYRARHGIQTDSGAVHISTQYDAELGRLDPSNLDIRGLTSTAKLKTADFDGTKLWEFRMTSDEPSALTKGGDNLYVDNWERLGGLNVASGVLFHAGIVSTDWPECSFEDNIPPENRADCGPGSTRNFFPLSGNPADPAWPFPNPRVTEGWQRPGAVIANNMVYWRVIQGGLTGFRSQGGSACPAPIVWGPAPDPARPAVPPSFERPLRDYLDMDLTQPRAVGETSPVVQRLRAEINTLVSSPGHWAPFFFERGMTQTFTWPYTVTDGNSPPEIHFNGRGNASMYDPGELLLAAAQAYPYLDATLQGRLRTWMSAEMNRLPPLRNLPYFRLDGNYDWLRTGQARETYQVPFRANLNNWPPAAADLGAIYALWLWSRNTNDWGYARANFAQATELFNNRVPSARFASDLGGMIGYYRLAKALGNSGEAARGEAAAVAFMERLRANPGSFLQDADNLYLDPRVKRTGWTAPALFGLVPEVGRFLREGTGGAFANYLLDKEYGAGGNGVRWWYITRVGSHAEIGETSYLNPISGWSFFLAHAYLFEDDRETLQNYLDRPWGSADIYSIMKLAATLQARPRGPDFSASTVRLASASATDGAEVRIRLVAVNGGEAPKQPVQITLQLPPELVYQTDTMTITPLTGNSSTAGSVITWTGTFPSTNRLEINLRTRIRVADTQPRLTYIVLRITNPEILPIEFHTTFVVNPITSYFPGIFR